jgi:hypothetical protein
MIIQPMEESFYTLYKPSFHLAFPTSTTEIHREHFYLVHDLFEVPLIVQIHYDQETKEMWLAWRGYTICPEMKSLKIIDDTKYPFKCPNNELYQLYHEMMKYAQLSFPSNN